MKTPTPVVRQTAMVVNREPVASSWAVSRLSWAGLMSVMDADMAVSFCCLCFAFLSFLYCFSFVFAVGKTIEKRKKGGGRVKDKRLKCCALRGLEELDLFGRETDF